MARSYASSASRALVGTLLVTLRFVEGAEHAKKRTVRSMTDRLRALKVFSVAEVSAPEERFQAQIAIAWVGTNRTDGQRAFQRALHVLELGDALVVDQIQSFAPIAEFDG